LREHAAPADVAATRAAGAPVAIPAFGARNLLSGPTGRDGLRDILCLPRATPAVSSHRWAAAWPGVVTCTVPHTRICYSNADGAVPNAICISPHLQPCCLHWQDVIEHFCPAGTRDRYRLYLQQAYPTFHCIRRTTRTRQHQVSCASFPMRAARRAVLTLSRHATFGLATLRTNTPPKGRRDGLLPDAGPAPDVLNMTYAHQDYRRRTYRHSVNAHIETFDATPRRDYNRVAGAVCFHTTSIHLPRISVVPTYPPTSAIYH